MAKQFKIKEDIHYSSCFGLISRSEAVENGYEVELTPYLEKGTYTYVQTIDGNLFVKDEDGDERELNGEYDWMEFD